MPLHQATFYIKQHQCVHNFYAPYFTKFLSLHSINATEFTTEFGAILLGSPFKQSPWLWKWEILKHILTDMDSSSAATIHK